MLFIFTNSNYATDGVRAFMKKREREKEREKKRRRVSVRKRKLKRVPWKVKTIFQKQFQLIHVLR